MHAINSNFGEIKIISNNFVKKKAGFLKTPPKKDLFFVVAGGWPPSHQKWLGGWVAGWLATSSRHQPPSELVAGG